MPGGVQVGFAVCWRARPLLEEEHRARPGEQL